MPRGRGVRRARRGPQRQRHRNVPERQRAPPEQAMDNDAPPLDNARDRGKKRGADDLEEDLMEENMLEDNADVWILGDSIPYWAGVHATTTGKKNLKLKDSKLAWWGRRGLGWSGLRRHNEAEVLLATPPMMIIVHLGGNDLVNLKTPAIRQLIEQEVTYLRDAFPDATIIWCDILQRQVWQGANGGYIPIETKRKRLNRMGRKIVRDSGRSDVITIDIDAKTAFYRPDGVHFNLVGLEFYLDCIKEAIIKNSS